MNNLDIKEKEFLFAPLLNVLQGVSAVPESDQPLIRDAFVIRKAKANEILLLSGDKAKELFFIVNGILKITSLNEKGNHVTHFFKRKSVLLHFKQLKW